MSTTTPYLGLTLYDSTTDQAVTFATFRAVWGGTATTSNFYKIDTAVSSLNDRVTDLEDAGVIVTVEALFISSNFYQATGVTGITAYNNNQLIVLSVDTTSSGTVTLDINSLGTKSVMKVNSSGTPINLTGSDLVIGRKYLFTYDGTRWLWVSANSADQIQIVGTVGNVVTVGSSNNLDGTLTQSLLVSQTINSATEKTSMGSSDKLGLVDASASNVLKWISWTNTLTAIVAGIGSAIAALTSKNPTTSDSVLVSSFSDSNATRKVVLSNLYKGLGTGTQDSTTFLRGDGTYAVPSVAEVPGVIKMYGGASAPSGYLLCDGSAVSRTTYSDLFTVVGTTFGTGDGSTTFNVPDMRRRVGMGAGGTGTATIGNAVGNTGGAETHTLVESEIPAHTHGLIKRNSATAFGSLNRAAAPTGGSDETTTAAITSTGGDAAHNNIQPSIILNFIIKT